MPLTANQFKRLTAREKGYVVHMAGARDDQPNVPKSYEPSAREREEYEYGQALAVQETQDSP